MLRPALCQMYTQIESARGAMPDPPIARFFSRECHGSRPPRDLDHQ